MLKITKQLFSRAVIDKESMLTATISIIHNVVYAVVSNKEYEVSRQSLLPFDKELYSTVTNDKYPLHTIRDKGVSKHKTDSQLKIIMKYWLPVKDGMKVKGEIKDNLFNIIKYKI